MRPKILLIDDEAQIRKFLRIALGAQDWQVVEADTGRRGLALAAVERPDAVVLDLGLPDLDGIAVLQELRSFSSVPVIVLSVRDAEAEKVRALDGGANDYVTKPFGIQEFMARLRALLRLRAAPEPEGHGYDDGHLQVDPGTRRVAVDGQPVALSRKEYGFLWLLMRHRPRIVTQTQLLRELWGPDHLQDTQYLRVVAQHLRQKLGDDAAAPRYIRTEAGVGYAFMGR